LSQLLKLEFIDRTQKYMNFRGKPIPRSKLFFVDNLDSVPIYKYTGFQYAAIQSFQLIQSNPIITAFHTVIKERFNVTTNHVIVTIYQNGKDSIGWHDDKPTTLHPTDSIFILSFGQQRPLLFRKNSNKADITSVSMQPGSLFVLGQQTNINYKHGIAKSKEKLLPRISLIYLTVINRIPMSEIAKGIIVEKKKKEKKANKEKQKEAVVIDLVGDNEIESELDIDADTENEVEKKVVENKVKEKESRQNNVPVQGACFCVKDGKLGA
jgi:hypothetical protein